MGRMKSLFKKNKAVKAAEKNAEKSMDNAQSSAKKGKPHNYALLVEDVFESNRLQGVMVIGNLYGKIKQGETMYLYQPEKPVKEVHVRAIELGPREEVVSAKNQQVGLCLDLESVEEVSRYAVLSNIRPIEGQLAERIVVNPRLLGLTMEYRRLYTNSTYMDELLAELCRSRFLLPLYIGQPPVPQADGSFSFASDAQVGFHSLKKWDDENQTVFPAFTDEMATLNWKDAFKEGQPRRFGVMYLPKIIEFVEKGHAGLVINPFGPASVFFPAELLGRVKESEFYKKMFAKPDENTN